MAWMHHRVEELIVLNIFDFPTGFKNLTIKLMRTLLSYTGSCRWLTIWTPTGLISRFIVFCAATRMSFSANFDGFLLHLIPNPWEENVTQKIGINLNWKLDI